MSNNRYANIINPNLPSDSPTSTVTNPMTTNLSMGGNKIVSVNRATAPDSVPTLGQVQSLIDNGSWVPTATSDLNMNYKNITTAQSYGLQPSQPSNPPLILSNQGTGNNLLLAMAKTGGDGMAFVYDTVYNKPPTASFVSTATSDLDMATNQIKNCNELDLVAGQGLCALGVAPTGGLKITSGTWASGYGTVYDSKYNPLPSGGGGWVGTATSDLNMASHGITGVQGINTASITVPYNQIYSQNTALAVTRDGEATFGYIYDSHYNQPPSGGIAGLEVDSTTNLLKFNKQPVMINQYVSTQTPITMTSTVSAGTSLDTSTTVIGTGTITGNFEELFSSLDGYTFNITMGTSDIASHFPPFPTDSISQSVTDLYVRITDSTGTNILLNPYAGQPCFYFQNTGFTFSAENGTLTFSMAINESSVPATNDKYFIYTQGLRPNLVGPFTITYSIFSFAYGTNGAPNAFSTIDSVSNCTFGFIGPDMSNPFPVVSNYDLTNGITTIRTSQYGSLIKSYRSGGTTFYTDSIQLVPTRSTTPKMYYGCQSGTYSNDPPINFALDIFPIPLTQFTFQWWIFCWGDSNNYITYTASGIADPNANQIYGESGNLGRYAGTIISPTEGAFSCSVSVGGLAISAVPISSSWNWTLTYDITSL